MALGHREIPAIVVQVSKEERMLRSLVENVRDYLYKLMEEQNVEPGDWEI